MAHHVGHAHAHDHSAPAGHAHPSGGGQGAGGRIALAFALNVGFTLIELVGAWYTNSVAVLADALHDLGDSLALGFAWAMERVAGRAPDARFSYGYRRFSLLAALVTGMVLLAGSPAIVLTAVPRLLAAEPIRVPGVLGLAVLGVAVNGFAALRTRAGGSLSERMVTLHLLEDVLGWALVLVMAAVLAVTDWYWLDPLVSLAIAAIILWNVARNLHRTLLVFLQATPRGQDLAAIEGELGALPAIRGVHDTPLWSMDGVYHVLSTHLVVGAGATLEDIAQAKRAAREVLAGHRVDHATVEVEREGERCELRHCR
jgi:cobalt-zinc-cadmium efflux system protein